MAHSAETHGEGHAHSTRIYWITAAVLAVLTAMEVGIFILNEGNGALMSKTLEVIILLILSFAKGTLVVSNFMHLRGDAAIFNFLFVAPFLMASAMLLSFLLIHAAPHVGIAG